MGTMEGRRVSEWQGPLPGNMEAASVLCKRADKWWKNTIVRRAQARPRADNEDTEEAVNVLVVSHGGLLHVLVQGLIESRKVRVPANLKGMEDGRYRFPNASVTVIEVYRNGKGTLSLFADTTHLNVELVEGNVDIIDDKL